MNKMRIAVGQAEAVSGEVSRNVQTALRLLSRAAEQEADLLVLPELFLCGYDLQALTEMGVSAAINVEDEAVVLLRQRCAELGIAVTVGASLRTSNGMTNSALVVDSCGEVIDIYEKVNLWAEERKLFVAGDRLSIMELAGFRVGVAICYDAGFPEHIRALTLSGAEVIVCPSAFALGDEQRRYRMYFPMRALENTVYVAVSNLVGRGGREEFFGESAVFDPAGRTIADAGHEEGISVAEVSRERIAVVRRELRYLEHRRPEIYSS